MRSPSRFVLTSLASAFVVFSLASTASADSTEQPGTIDPAAFQPITRVQLVHDLAAADVRVAQRLNLALSGPTTMECTNSLDAGFETCVVRAEGMPVSGPSSLARN